MHVASIIMRNIFLLLSSFLCVFASAQATGKQQMFLSAKTQQGVSIKTNDYLKATDKNRLSLYGVRLGFSPSADSWKSVEYSDPYAGVGFSYLRHEDDAFGHPLTLYLFQGGRIVRLAKPISLMYECQLGYSFNWGHYDRYTQPNNICIGSSENVNVGLDLYLKLKLTKRLNLSLGGGFCHFSNGANMMPNKGMNAASAFVDIAYRLSDEVQRDNDTIISLPQKEGRFEHQIMATYSARQKYFSVVGTGLSTQYVNNKFRVFGLSYAFMKIQNFKYKWGPCLDLLYDESSCSYALRELNPVDSLEYDHVYKGKMRDRFSVGLSMKGEVKMPYCSYFANLGYDVLHGNDYDARLYEIIGVKADLVGGLSAIFGIRATNFSKAQFFYWTLSYSFVRK